MAEKSVKATNVMILEKDGLIRRAFAKLLSDSLPPDVEVVVADDDVLCDRKAAEKFVRERTPEYRALIGIQSENGETLGRSDGSELLRIVLKMYKICEVPRPILVGFQALHVLKEFHKGEECMQEASLYYFLQVPLKVRELVCLLPYGEVFRD